MSSPESAHGADDPYAPLLARLIEAEGDLTFFPVRHHSPASAALLSAWIARRRPAAVLVEGPSDYNPYLDELFLDHELPIAIYTYARGPEGTRGAYYPFCDYSPEWAALVAGRAVGARLAFIDLPGRTHPAPPSQTHRYADAALRASRYTEALCRRLMVEDFDDLWDKLVEAQRDLSLADYLVRVHGLCLNTRIWEREVRDEDRRREAFMADQVRGAVEAGERPVLVVTGGYHSAALLARVEGEAQPSLLVCPGLDTPVAPEGPAVEASEVALTAYAYERLDGLTGYDAGMPSPGFYDHVHRQRPRFDHRPLLGELVEHLRSKGQVLSTADLIAVETTAQALAALRGRPHVWRRDLVDAVTSALLKDELAVGSPSPFLDAVHAVLRGRRRGRVAAGARVPPLVTAIKARLAEGGLSPAPGGRTVDLDLLGSEHRAQSRLLHALRVLEIRGFVRSGGTDFLERDDLTRIWEQWQIRWSPDFEASCVDAARYGATVEDAVVRRLRAAARTGDAETAAALLVSAAQAGVVDAARTLVDRLAELIRAERAFVGAASALAHLVFLYCHDEALGTTDRPEVADLLREAFARSLWLLELAQGSEETARLVRGMRALLDARQRAAAVVADEPTVAVLARVQADGSKPGAARGAAAGILWTLGEAREEDVLSSLRAFSDPEALGDYLTGLFSAAREAVQRTPAVVRTLDALLAGLSGDAFVGALPSLRLAFTYFTPREKHHMLVALFGGDADAAPLPTLEVDASVAAEALAVEDRLFATLERYGLAEP